MTLKLIGLTKLHKRKQKFFIFKFDNKASQAIQLLTYFNHIEVTKGLTYTLQYKEIISTVTYKLGTTIRNNILNDIDVVNSVYIDQEVSFKIFWHTSQTCPNRKETENHRKQMP